MDWNHRVESSPQGKTGFHALRQVGKNILQKHVGQRKIGSSSLPSRSEPNALYAGDRKEKPYRQCMLGSAMLPILLSVLGTNLKHSDPECSEIIEQEKICQVSGNT